MRRLATLLLVLVAALALPLRAQDTGADDKSFLETWLQTNLSSAGREVRITGFEGALSSQATIGELTIADDTGVWLSLRGVQLDWTRSALLAGRLEIDRLTADEIQITRRPVTAAAGPQASASDFSLPELPVSIRIGRIEARRVALGAPVLGVAAEMRLAGSGALEAGAGHADLMLERIDGQLGTLHLAGGYANDSRVLALDLSLSEGPGGIVAGLTGLPGGPPLALSVAGDGPIDGFSADIALATDGVDRLAGRVTLSAEAPDGGPAADAALGFSAALNGDPSPLFAPGYGAFFGADVQLSLTGRKHPDGRLDIAAFALKTAALDLTGTAALTARGWVDRAHLAGSIGTPDGTPVLLPIAGAPTRIDRAQVAFDYDSAQADGWSGALSFEGLARDDLALASARLLGTGTLAAGDEALAPRIAGTLDIDATGIAPANPDLAAALGPRLTGQLAFAREGGAPLQLSALALDGADYGLSGALSLATDWQKLDLIASGDVTLRADSLARFGGLAGQPIAGAARLQISGAVALPGGPFDVTIAGTGQDLAIAMPWFDRPFAGASTLSIAAVRDRSGTRIDRFSIAAPGATAQASASLTAQDSRVDAQLEVADVSLLVDGLAGALSLSATARQSGADWQVDLDATAPGATSAHGSGVITIAPGGPPTARGEITASAGSLTPYGGLAGRALSGGASLAASGTYGPETGAFTLRGSARSEDFGLGLGDLDRLTAGPGRADFALGRDGDGTLRIDRLELQTAELSAALTGSSSAGRPTLAAQGRLRDLGLIVPGLTGALTAEADASLTDAGWQLTATGAGPGGTLVQASGQVAADAGRATLAITGRAPLALANPFIAPQQVDGTAAFDLALNGPLALASVSGTIRTEGARVALPTQRFALDPVVATARISGAEARLEATLALTSGGRVSLAGPVSLVAPYRAELTARLDGIALTDPALYDTVANGALTLSGPLAGGAAISGQIALGTVELRVPESGLGVDGSLPGLAHVAEPAAVAATRARAGLTGGPGTGGGGTPYALDLLVTAPDRVFLRGRGLDAELGGTLRLGGTTQAIAAEGGFELIRGRLDLLGNRLVLTEGSATLQGSLDPFVRLVAETRAEDVAVRITVEGLASDPAVTFSSSPDLPEDEILARLVFGRGLDQISPFQALKLASAVATLSGKSGAGTISRLREGFGLDDLDVTTDARGEIAVRAGAYVTENIYTDVTVGADGRSEINLNLSISPSVTARGRVSTDGDTGIGIYFEKDY